jgi:hypothetical protein
MTIMSLETAALLFVVTILAAGCSGPGNEPGATYPPVKVDIDSMKATVRFLADMNPPRNYKNISSMNRSAAFIKQKMESYGLRTEEQKFDVDDRTYVNIIGTVAAEKKSRIVVGAHYDVCDDQPGADDNASAVAGLLEIAHFAKEHEAELLYRMDFVAYALEEPPFFGTENMGSYIHAKSLRDANVEVKGMISLEMIGYFSDKHNSQEYPLALLKLFYPNKGNFIAVVGNFGSSGLVSHMEKHMKAASIQVESLKAPASLTGVDFSDHRNYWNFGYEAVMITDTAFFRNPNYHNETDTFDTLDFNKMAEAVRGVCWALLRMGT